MRVMPGSLTPEILRLADQGVAVKEIARRVGCRWPNVYKTLRRYDRLPPPAEREIKTFRVSALSQRDREWLRSEARRMRVNWRDLARALLIDAINEVRDEHKDR